MISLVTKDPVPYVPLHDRTRDPNSSEPSTIAWIIPMLPEESANFRARWRAIMEEGNTPLVIRSREAVKLDKETLLQRLTKIENIGTAGTLFEGSDLPAVVDTIDYVLMQEFLLAAQSMALLKAGERKN